jgi:hypothetical protein
VVCCCMRGMAVNDTCTWDSVFVAIIRNRQIDFWSTCPRTGTKNPIDLLNYKIPLSHFKFWEITCILAYYF